MHGSTNRKEEDDVTVQRGALLHHLCFQDRFSDFEAMAFCATFIVTSMEDERFERVRPEL